MRTDVVSIEELVTILADRALKQNDVNQQNDTNHDLSPEEKEAILLRRKQSQHQIVELMDILPNLQYGMDINPKFMHGPEGYEYTKNLTAFDIIGVNLVHGWLMNPDEKIASIVGNKTYNELVEMVCKGKDTEDELKKLEELLGEKKMELEKNGNDVSTEKNEDTLSKLSESDWVEVSKEQESEEETEASDDGGKADDSIELQKHIADLENKRKQLEDFITNGHVIKGFLEDTGHQLTRYGLEKLHEHVDEGSLCVFFRNNHFSTMTKFEGQLFLLVTDLGYATVDDVVWEKLDAIDGNTDFFNAFFFKPEPRDDFLMDNGSSLTPEQMVAQRGQSERDYELALQLSSEVNNRNNASTRAEEQAIYASLQEYNGNNASHNTDSNPSQQSKAAVQSDQNQSVEGAFDRDRALALSLQSQYQNQDASERLARQLYEEELRQRKQRVGNSTRRNQQGRNNGKSESSGCIIS